MRQLLILLLLYFAASVSLAGQYTVSKGWPTGIHGHVDQMQEEDRPLCVAVEKALGAKGSLDSPLPCDRPLDGATQLKRVSWTFLDKAQLFPLAQRLTVLSEKRWGRDGKQVESEAFRTNVTSLIESGSMSISTAKVPAGSDGSYMVIVRYQRRACDPNNAEHDFGRVELFVADSETLENLQPLIGLGAPTDMFLYGGRAYFDSHAYRLASDSGSPLNKSQALIQIHRMFDTRSHVRVCRLLYWDEDLTPRSSGRDKSRRSP